jgi:bacterioferritin-associated ferredoxin
MAHLNSQAKSLCDERRVVCHCFRVTETVIRAAIDILGSSSVREVTEHTGAGAGCTACHCRIKRMLAGESAMCCPFTVCGDCGFYTPLCECEAA